MSSVLAALSLAALVGLAAAGVAAGFLRRDPVPVEPLADPLEDRRLALLRSLADLESARQTGALEEAEYRRLRGDTETRIARVLRALEGRNRKQPSDSAAVGLRTRPAARVPSWAVAALLGTTVLAVTVTGLLRSSEGAPAEAPSAAATDPLAFFEGRVREHPNDLAARLDLAHRYLDAQRFDEALAEYAVALELDPDDAEAHAHVGIILFRSGRPEQALEAVDRSLRTAPEYPEALFARGVILLRGLDQPAEAVEAFEAYLDAAPFGAERAAAHTLISEAEEVLSSG